MKSSAERFQLITTIALSLHAVIAGIISLLALFWSYQVNSWLGFHPLRVLPVLIFAALFWASLWLLRSPKRHLRRWIYLLLSVVVLWFSFKFFVSPMHDIALWFGSHGRFGCRIIDSDGNPITWLDQDTLPWILFALPPVFPLFAWFLTGLSRSRSMQRR